MSEAREDPAATPAPRARDASCRPAMPTRGGLLGLALGSTLFAGVHALLEESPLHGVAGERERRSKVPACDPVPPATKLELPERRGVERVGGKAIAVFDRAEFL